MQGTIRTEGAILTGTSATTVYTVASAFSVLTSINVANTTGSAVNATVGWYDASATATYQLTGTTSIAANGSLFIEFEAGFQLAEDDEIRVTAGTGNALHVAVTAYEQAGRSG